MQHENIKKFVQEFTESLEKQTFVKMTLGNHKSTDEQLQKILIRLVAVKKGARLFFLYRYDARDVTKNYEFAEGFQIIENLLGKDFFAAHLFTTENDFQLDIGKKNARIHAGKPTFKTQPNQIHNREKPHLIDQNAFWLKALNITNERGEIRDKQSDKWRQINKFVEIVGGLFDGSDLKDKRKITIVDMGSGKGYLTFAVYDFFTNKRGISAKVTGVETRDELVTLCNDVARAADFQNLKFERGFINNFEMERADILIALHACNTATDDAIFAGICAASSLIIAAPCCHQEIRPQIEPPEMFKNVLKHGSLLERTAETVTDGLRALLLERSGYATKVFEFIAPEHTPKNNLIVGTKRAQTIETEKFAQQIDDIKDFYSIREQRLEKLLQNLSLQ